MTSPLRLVLVCVLVSLVFGPALASASTGPYAESRVRGLEICPSCGFQFGVTDDDRGFTYDAWRKRWIARGMPWDSGGVESPPEGWDPRKQLRRLTKERPEQQPD